MTTDPTDAEAIIGRAIEALGGPTKAAEKLQLASPSVILNWRLRKSIPAGRVAAISALTGIPAHELKPGVFPAPKQGAAA